MNRCRFMPGASQCIIFHLLDPVDDVDDPLIDATPHKVKCSHAFSFVLDLRVNLRVTPQADAAAEMIHCQQVILPGVIKNL